MIFTRSRNAATGDNSMYCMIPDPFPSSAFGKGSATPDYGHCQHSGKCHRKSEAIAHSILYARNKKEKENEGLGTRD